MIVFINEVLEYAPETNAYVVDVDRIGHSEIKMNLTDVNNNGSVLWNDWQEWHDALEDAHVSLPQTVEKQLTVYIG